MGRRKQLFPRFKNKTFYFFLQIIKIIQVNWEKFGKQRNVESRKIWKTEKSKQGRAQLKNKYKWPMDMDNRVGGDWLWEWVAGRAGESNGGKLGQLQ